MPIYHREVDGATVIHFGIGDIAISPGYDAGTGRWEQLIFSPGEPGEIGRVAEHEGMTSDQLPRPITALVFDNVESLDVVAGELATLRARMISGEVGRVQ